MYLKKNIQITKHFSWDTLNPSLNSMDGKRRGGPRQRMKKFKRHLNGKFLLLPHIPQSLSGHRAGLAQELVLLDNVTFSIRYKFISE